MYGYEDAEAREMVARKRAGGDPVPPFPLSAVLAVIQLLWVALKWLVLAVWSGVKWLRRLLSGEMQSPS
jgi:hypothetical protein